MAGLTERVKLSTRLYVKDIMKIDEVKPKCE